MKELMERMDSEEFTYQMAYYRSNRWGDEWMRTAVVAQASFAANPHIKKLPPLETFMPKRAKTQKEIKESVNSFFMRLKELAKNGNQPIQNHGTTER